MLECSKWSGEVFPGKKSEATSDGRSRPQKALAGSCKVMMTIHCTCALDETPNCPVVSRSAHRVWSKRSKQALLAQRNRRRQPLCVRAHALTYYNTTQPRSQPRPTHIHSASSLSPAAAVSSEEAAAMSSSSGSPALPPGLVAGLVALPPPAGKTLAYGTAGEF
jgi:hypothetical protein